MGEIQRNVIKQGKRNVISQHLHARNDKDKIGGWKLDLNRILHVFNVRSVASVRLLLTVDYQVELVINIHVDVSNTRIMVSEIHRTIVKGQEGSGGTNLLVSDTWTVSATEQYSLLSRLNPGQKSELPVYPPSYV